MTVRFQNIFTVIVERKNRVPDQFMMTKYLVIRMYVSSKYIKHEFGVCMYSIKHAIFLLSALYYTCSRDFPFLNVLIILFNIIVFQ
jgi:hypothetical protein